jgi:hypothetical protein
MTLNALDTKSHVFVPNYEHTVKRDLTVHSVARMKESLEI